MTSANLIKYNHFSFDFSRCEVHIGSSITELEPKVMEVLAVLHKRQGEVISQQEIFEKVWQGRVYSQSLIQRAITLIRKALKEDASNAQYLITYPKKGYCLTPQVNAFRLNLFTPSNVLKISLCIVIIVGCLFIYLFASNLSPVHKYTSLSSITKKPTNDFSLSQHTTSGELLFIRKKNEYYELWQKSSELEKRLYVSKNKILHTFWLGGSPAITQLNEQNLTSFLQLVKQDETQLIFEKDIKLTSAPITNESIIYFSSNNTIYEFNIKTNVTRILHIFTDIKEIRDISFFQSLNQIAILFDKGQLNHQIATLDLKNLSLKELYRNSGKYNSIDWHPKEQSLLLTKSNKLMQLNIDGSTNSIDYATDKELSSAIFAQNASTIYIEHNYLNVSLVESMDINGDILLSGFSYSGANLFPKHNVQNSKLLFQSDHSGLQTIYLKEGENEIAIGQASKGQHINGYTWSPNGQKIAYAINKEITIKDAVGEGGNKKIELESSLYIRGWFYNEDRLLVNQIIGGKPYPAALNLRNNTIEKLSESSASCVVLENNNNLFFVQSDRKLIKQTPEGKRQIIHHLMNDKYDDLFISKNFLYASVKGKNTYYVQKFDLNNLSLSQFELPNKVILAGVSNNDTIWSYKNIEYKSSLHKLF